MPDCTGLGRILRHRYEPRYTVRRIEETDANGAKSLDYTRTYECDVCRRCGDRIEGRATRPAAWLNETAA